MKGIEVVLMKSAPLACFVHNQFPWNRIQPAPDIVDGTLKPAKSDEYRSKPSSMRKRSETTRYTFIAFISAY